MQLLKKNITSSQLCDMMYSIARTRQLLNVVIINRVDPRRSQVLIVLSIDHYMIMVCQTWKRHELYKTIHMHIIILNHMVGVWYRILILYTWWKHLYRFFNPALVFVTLCYIQIIYRYIKMYINNFVLIRLNRYSFDNNICGAVVKSCVNLFCFT